MKDHGIVQAWRSWRPAVSGTPSSSRRPTPRGRPRRRTSSPPRRVWPRSPASRRSRSSARRARRTTTGSASRWSSPGPTRTRPTTSTRTTSGSSRAAGSPRWRTSSRSTTRPRLVSAPRLLGSARCFRRRAHGGRSAFREAARARRRGRGGRAGRDRVHLHGGPDLDGGRVAPLQRHARRQAPPLAPRRGRHGAARPEQQVQRHDARQRRQPDRLRARHELRRPRAAGRHARDDRDALGRQGAEQPERRDRRPRRLDPLHRPDVRAACPVFGLPREQELDFQGVYRLPAAAATSSCWPTTSRSRTGSASRPTSRSSTSTTPTARTSASSTSAPTTSSRTGACSPRASAPRASRSGDLVDGMKLDEQRQRLRHRPRGRLGLLARGRAPRHDRGAGERRQRQLGRRRLADALHPGLDVGLPRADEGRGQPARLHDTRRRRRSGPRSIRSRRR